MTYVSMTDAEGGTAAGDLRVDGVVLTAGTASVPGLSLVVGTRGIALLGPSPGHRRDLAWSSLDGARVDLPTGRRRRHTPPALVLTSAGRTVACFLPPGTDRLVLDRLAWWVAPWTTPDGSPAAARPTGPPAAPARRSHPVGPGRSVRPRRRMLLVAGLVLVAAGLGIGSLQVAGPGRRPARGQTGTPANRTTDQRLADHLVLTQGDVPPGWRAAPAPAAQPSPTGHDQAVLARVTGAFGRCLGVSTARGATVLGDPGPDQTAARSSPVFTGPTTSGSAGLELQTSVSVVRSRADEVADLAPVSSPRYPGCVASAIAAEMQLGVDDVTGGSRTPTGVTGAGVPVPPVAGLRVTAVSASFELGEGRGPVPVEAAEVVLGTGRVEAQLQLFAVGTPFPPAAFHAALTAFEVRLLTAAAAVSL